MKKIFLLTLFLSIAYWLNGQVRMYYQPTTDQLTKVNVAANSVVKAKRGDVDVNRMVLPSFNVQEMLQEDSINSAGNVSVPFRFGKGFDTDLSLTKSGAWQNTDDGRMWTMHFHSPGAKSLNFIFEDFHLPDSAELYIVNSDRTALYGPVTAPCIPENGFFMTDLIPGDDVSILLYEPGICMGQSELKITRVVHAYRGFSYNGDNESSRSGELAPCHNDVDCFSDWNMESHAVAKVLLGSADYLCSGSLVMSADYSFKPYFLTAFHCLDSDCSESLSSAEQNAVNQWTFIFNYKKGCGNGAINTGVSYNGAIFRAGNFDSDFALLELLSNLTNASNSHAWLGWDRSGNTPSSSTYIHHPNGAPMKISFDYQPLALETESILWNACFGTIISPINTHWKTILDNGVVQGGSSGSPLLNQNKRIVGQLHGGKASCSYNETTYSGAFHKSWIGGGTNTTRLSNWLDPNNSGVQTINTSYLPVISGANIICPHDNPHNYYISGIPSNSNVTWTCNGGISITPNGSSCSVNAITPGVASISAQLSENVTIYKNIEVSSTTGSPYITYSYSGSDINLVVHTSNIYGIQQYIWSASGTGGSYNATTGPNGDYWTIPRGNYTVQCRVVTPCGHLIATTSITGSRSSVSPNPVDHTLYVNLSELMETEENSIVTARQAVPSNSYELRLFDSQGSLVRNLRMVERQMSINVSNLSNGIYFLHIYKSGITQPEVHKVIVSH